MPDRVRVPDETLREPTPLWDVLEITLHGPNCGNPFLDVELSAVFTREGHEIRVGGFYDGDGVYRIRALADIEGEWSFVTHSTEPSLDGIKGTATVTAARAGAHGPVRVDGFHFQHADGTRYRPLGTTAYAWTHQSDELQERTLRSLAAAPFTKLRMCLFPKSYLYNTSEPEDFPGSLEEGFDLQRFAVTYFQRIERRVAQLAELGVQADLMARRRPRHLKHDRRTRTRHTPRQPARRPARTTLHGRPRSPGRRLIHPFGVRRRSLVAGGGGPVSATPRKRCQLFPIRIRAGDYWKGSEGENAL